MIAHNMVDLRTDATAMNIAIYFTTFREPRMNLRTLNASSTVEKHQILSFLLNQHLFTNFDHVCNALRVLQKDQDVKTYFSTLDLYAEVIVDAYRCVPLDNRFQEIFRYALNNDIALFSDSDDSTFTFFNRVLRIFSDHLHHHLL